jgi:hypothetical protein
MEEGWTPIPDDSGDGGPFLAVDIARSPDSFTAKSSGWTSTPYMRQTDVVVAVAAAAAVVVVALAFFVLDPHRSVLE